LTIGDGVGSKAIVGDNKVTNEIKKMPAAQVADISAMCDPLAEAVEIISVR